MHGSQKRKQLAEGVPSQPRGAGALPGASGSALGAVDEEGQEEQDDPRTPRGTYLPMFYKARDCMVYLSLGGAGSGPTAGDQLAPLVATLSAEAAADSGETPFLSPASEMHLKNQEAAAAEVNISDSIDRSIDLID